MLVSEINLSSGIPRPIPTVGLPKIPTTITATTTSSSNSNTKLSNKLPTPKPLHHQPSNSPPDPNKPIINPITNRKSYDHITDRELRKKLKNRESAQAARDRKKAKMLALERQLADMAERNKLLENQNRELQGRISRMEAEAFWRLVKNPADGKYIPLSISFQIQSLTLISDMYPYKLYIKSLVVGVCCSQLGLVTII